MNHRITFQQVVDRLQENDLPHTILQLQNEARLVISERGGRIFGPFLSEAGESILWMNGAFAKADTFQAFLAAGDWNFGGERVRIGPELQYAVPDRTRFWETYTLSPQDDPGQYQLSPAGLDGVWRLSKDMVLEAYPAHGKKLLHLDRLIRDTANPLRDLSSYPDLMHGVRYMGYEHSLTLSESDQDRLMSHSWNLIQINPGGTLWMPVTPALEYTNYYEPVDANFQTISASAVRLKISGNRKYKVGYKAAHLFGRVAYFNNLDPGNAYLIIRNFYSNPSSPYLDEPYHAPGRRGDSLQVYQDDGQLGGFAEIECIGQAIGGQTGKSTMTDLMTFWCYVGAPHNLKQLAWHLLGNDLS